MPRKGLHISFCSLVLLLVLLRSELEYTGVSAFKVSSWYYIKRHIALEFLQLSPENQLNQFVSIGPIVAGSIALLSAYIGIWLVCHRCYKAQWVLVHLLFCCAIILLLASALFARQYVNFQVVASSNSFSLSMRYEQTNDRTIAFYNKWYVSKIPTAAIYCLCSCVNNFPNVVPARSCSDISSTSDCYGDIPNLGGSCACYISKFLVNQTTRANDMIRWRYIHSISEWNHWSTM